MNSLLFFPRLVFMFILTIACSEKEPQSNPTTEPLIDQEPQSNLTTEPLTEKERCEKIIESHANCLESIFNKKLDGTQLVEAFEKCSENSINSTEQSIQSEKMKNDLKGILTASNSVSFPETPNDAPCFDKDNENDGFVCLIRAQKQTSCS